jgi:hypothetical protein
MLTILHHPKTKKTFCLASFLAKKIKTLAMLHASFFPCMKACHTKIFGLRMMKNLTISTEAS